MIKLDRVSYTYPNSTLLALSNVELEVLDGEFVLLAGSTGSGKTTLLRSINGLVPFFSGGTIQGTVTVNGISVFELGPQVMSRYVGFVPQNPEAHALLDRVEAEIAFGLENLGIPTQEMRVRVEEVLDLLDLTALRERTLTSLSGGERQRVAIASVLASRPQILLLDEPTSQLDPKSAEDVLRSLVRLNEDIGLTVIIAEHRLERVLRYADRLVYMENGRIKVDDSVRAALPNIPFVPPIGRLGQILGWDPLPVTIKEAKRFVALDTLEHDAARGRREPYKSVLDEDNKNVLLEVDKVSFAYDGTVALRSVELSLYEREVLAVMGRNGSGKSTLLKCIMGFLRASQGSIVLNGVDTSGRQTADIAQEVAYLPQHSDDLLFADSVVEELQITLRNHRIDAPERIDVLLNQLSLGDYASAYPRDLSTGQRQRVALGAVTITQPKVVLLDEPTRGLDAEAKQQLVRIWRSWLNQGVGIILVTHDVELVASVADRVMIFSQGEVIASGPTGPVLASSPLFAPQIARLFPDSDWLSVDDAVYGLRRRIIETSNVD